ncbi:MAG: lipid-A-disaccharide synthase, partial [Candidatus Omnitrophica bacterium]|nr:lipid-A-disaccharide synthase [Candidatus Omnitrophota bacterium]
MNPSPKHFIIIAGEASGDMHAAHLVTEIKKINPSITFSGLGGQNMQQAGVELYTDMTRLAVIGFIEVIKHYSEIKKIFNLTLKKVRDTNSDAVILVDYPGFNLRLARKLKKMNVKVIYYISPQVWAWKESRVKQIKKVVDQMLVLFSFEKEFYARHGMEVDLVGHPLIDTVKADTSRENVLDAVNFTSNKLTIGILPGSRDKEIETLLPPMLEAAAILNALHPHIQFLVSKA